MPCNWRKNKQGDNIMNLITQEQFDEIVGVISKYCCCYRSPFCCYETDDCDILDIYEILNRHIEREPINEEEEKLPFELDDDELL